MKKYKLSDMTKGWFIGDFSPTLVKTKDFEVAIKEYKKGDSEESHFHKIATEITVVSKGRVMLNNEVFCEGDIIEIKPNEIAKFEALEDSSTVVVKIPSVSSDKYIVS